MGLLEPWRPEMDGKILFVSHQWLSFSHPDPSGEQLDTLKGLLKRLLSGKTDVKPHPYQSMIFKDGDTGISGKYWQENLPQMSSHTTGAHAPAHTVGHVTGSTVPAHVTTHAGADHRHTETELSIQLTQAVRSIPAYVEHSAMMLVLAPVCTHADLPVVCNYPSWRSRGWCRMELMSALLARTDLRIILCMGDEAVPYLQTSFDALLLPAGKGDFACCQMGHDINGKKIGCDKFKVKSVLASMIDAKISHHFDQGERMHAHYFTCMRRKFLVGLPNNEAETATGAAALRAQLQWSPEDDTAAESTGWSLVHCAALADDAKAVRELAAEGEPVDKKLVAGVPALNLFPSVNPLLLALSFSSFETAEALLDAGADPTYKTVGQGFAEDAPMYMALNHRVDNLKAWKKRFADCDLNYRRPGCKSNCMLTASLYGTDKHDIIKELADLGCVEAPNAAGWGALHWVCNSADPDLEAVRYLIDVIGADVNGQRNADLPFLAFLIPNETTCYFGSKGKKDMQTLMFGHARYMTPLHCAAFSANVDTCKLLLAKGADPTLKNVQGCTPLQLAEQVYGTVPAALREVLEPPKPSKWTSCCKPTVEAEDLIPRHPERELEC
jgi:ankyrin repeat protein